MGNSISTHLLQKIRYKSWNNSKIKKNYEEYEVKNKEKIKWTIESNIENGSTSWLARTSALDKYIK